MFVVAKTDNKWYEFLHIQTNLELVNFWTPSDWKFKNLKPNDIFFFYLRSPVKKFGGYGYFVEYTTNVSFEEAWERFGIGNGFPTFEEFEKCLKPISKYGVNCAAIKMPLFFSRLYSPEELGIYVAPQMQTFKYVNNPDIGQLFQDDDFVVQEDNNFQILDRKTLIEYRQNKFKKRIGQFNFRQNVLQAYHNQCAITGERTPEVLEAAHIQEYKNKKSNHIQNGLSLRADIHKLFDDGLITINQSYRVVVSNILAQSSYISLHNKKIKLPADALCPSKDALNYHMKNIFKGKPLN